MSPVQRIEDALEREIVAVKVADGDDQLHEEAILSTTFAQDDDKAMKGAASKGHPAIATRPNLIAAETRKAAAEAAAEEGS